MSKYVKQLVTNTFKQRLDGVQYLMLVSLTGIDANKTNMIRANLAGKGISLKVVKNSLALRATEGTVLAAGFQDLRGATAVCWGATDVVSLAKEVVKLTTDKTLAGFEIKGAILDGEAVSKEQATEMSRWPTRQEQISLLIGQILGVGATLNGQLLAMGGALASQIAKKGEGDE